MNADPVFAPLTELRGRLARGELSALELAEAYLARIAETEGLHALTTVFGEEAREQARVTDRARSAGLPLGVLAGIPVTIKDSIPTRGLLTTCNSRAYASWVPDAEPAPIARLRRAGAIVLAKATPNEFLGIPSDDDVAPRPRSPYDPAYVGMGSSAGSGVSVAAGQCAASIGSDSAGSVRLPAAHHGLVGLKPTRPAAAAEISGAEATLTVLGPLVRCVDDAALVHAVLTGGPEPVPPRPVGARPLAGTRVGIPWRYLETSPTEPEVATAFERAATTLADLGAELVPLRPRGWAEGRMATFVVLYAEHHMAHAAALRDRGELYGASARRYALQGALLSLSDYRAALDLAVRLGVSFDRLLDDVHVVATPTCPFETAEASRRPSEHRQGMNTVFTALANLTGHPAITLPCGSGAVGLPVGLHLTAARGDEAELFRIGRAYESATPWHERRPAT
jgi:Asp-tRNA(Asn)/Glu-tRNA(Gln) amidotransferase A subunit family amidase